MPSQKRPSFQFYPGDWLKDPALRRVSAAARGALIDILCLAFESERRGVLATNGRPWTIGELANICHVKRKTIVELLENLVLHTASRTGVMFSARMVRDERLRRRRVRFGRSGGQAKGKQDPKQKGTPSSSSSSSPSGISSLSTKKKGVSVFPSALNTNEFKRTWLEWEQHRQEIRHELKASTIKAQLTKLEKLGHDKAIEVIRHSIEQGWTGLFEPRGSNQAGTDQCDATRRRNNLQALNCRREDLAHALLVLAEEREKPDPNRNLVARSDAHVADLQERITSLEKELE